MSGTEIQLRPAVSTDFVALVALERATENAPHWSPATYAAMLRAFDSGPKRCIFVAVRGESLVGFAVGVLQVSTAELESVVVSAAVRRLGVGRRLCIAVIDWARSEGAGDMVLEVRAISAAPIALYMALGFQQTGRRPRYYREPEGDALIMRLSLR